MADKTAKPPRVRRPQKFDLAHSQPVSLLRASHPRQAILTAAVLAAGAAMSGRATNEVGLVFATVLVGQVVLGWHNDVVDAARDRSHDRHTKPVAMGWITPGDVWFAIICGVLLVVPLAVASGSIELASGGRLPVAGISYLIALVIGMTANAGLLRRTRFSFLPWMASFALYPAFLAYGGWAGEGSDTPPTILMTVLAALLGVGVHVLTSLPGLVDDNKDGVRTFPLAIALRTGAPRLLLITTIYIAAVTAGILFTGLRVGLVQ